MKRRQITVIGALALVAAVLALIRMNVPETQAQTQPSLVASDIETLKESIVKFFEGLSSDPNTENGIEKAFKDFLDDSPLKENENLKTKFTNDVRAIRQNFGVYVSYEPIGVKMVGSDLVVFRYLYKFEKYPVVWYFTYYRSPKSAGSDPSSGWKLIGFRFDTNLDAALLDATFDQRN